MDVDELSLHEDGEVTEVKEKTNKEGGMKETLEKNNQIMENLLKLMANKKRRRSSSTSSSSSSSSSDSDLPHSSKRRGKKRRRKSRSKEIIGLRNVSPDPRSSGEELVTKALGDDEEASDREIPVPGKYDSARSGSEDSDWYREVNAEYELDTEEGDPISDNLAQFINKRFKEPLKEGKLKEKLDTYKKPRNCTGLTVRQTNKEIWSILRGYNRKADMKLTSLQKTITKATTAIARAADVVTGVAKVTKERSEKLKPAVKGLTDAILFLGHAQQRLTTQRKEAQRGALPFDMRGITDMVSDGDLWLYGEDVKSQIKEAREQRRLTSQLYTSRHPQSSFMQGRKRGHFLAKRGGHVAASSQRRRGQASSYGTRQAWNRRQTRK